MSLVSTKIFLITLTDSSNLYFKKFQTLPHTLNRVFLQSVRPCVRICHTSSFFHICSCGCLIRSLLQLGCHGEAGNPTLLYFHLIFNLRVREWNWIRRNLYLILLFFKSFQSYLQQDFEIWHIKTDQPQFETKTVEKL